jgi:hypothetical protein
MLLMLHGIVNSFKNLPVDKWMVLLLLLLMLDTQMINIILQLILKSLKLLAFTIICSVMNTKSIKMMTKLESQESYMEDIMETLMVEVTLGF